MTTKMARNIFCYWHQGRDAAPDAHKQCWDLWERMNPGWTLKIYDWGDVKDRFAEFGVDGGNMSLNGVANIVRIDRLAEEGGVWVDAYTVPLKPLDDWLIPLMDAGFFAHHDPYRKRLAENWFIAAEAGHPLAVAWRDRMVGYWRTARRPMRSRRELDPGLRGSMARAKGRLMDMTGHTLSARAAKHIYKLKDPLWSVAEDGAGKLAIYPYFAMAQLFDLMVSEQPELREAFRQYPKLTSYDCLLLRHWKRNYADLNAEDVRSMAAGKPMQKLNLKIPMPDHLMKVLVDMAEENMPGLANPAG